VCIQIVHSDYVQFKGLGDLIGSILGIAIVALNSLEQKISV